MRNRHQTQDKTNLRIHPPLLIKGVKEISHLSPTLPRRIRKICQAIQSVFPLLFFLLTLPALAIRITPSELLIRITPDAAATFQHSPANSAIAALHTKHEVESFRALFPYLARPSLQPNLTRTYLLRFSPDAPLLHLKAAYAESPLIEAVDYNYLRRTFADAVTPNDTKYPEQWNLPLMKLPQAWAIEKGNPNVVIAIIDSGIDYTHADLALKTWVNPGEIPNNGLDDDSNGYVDDIHGWDFTDAPTLQAEGDFLEGDNEPIDESGHGTHVAGIAGAMADNGIGIAGVAWYCPLMPVRAGLSLAGRTRIQDDDAAAAIVYAADNGASIINMSWGSEQSAFIIQDAIDYAYARGAILVAAAGNSQKAAPIFPAAASKVIAVASTEQNRQRFYQSNFGAAIDIAAPGNVILSTQIQNRYRVLTGTSMAAPHVAGVAALIRSKRPALNHEEVRQILINTAEPVFAEDSDELDAKFVGAGTVNAERALLASGALQARILVPETNQGGSNSIAFVGTAAGYKFARWQLSYGESTVPSAFTPFTVPSSQQKIGEPLAIWKTEKAPMGIYTVRLTVTGTDGSQTRDEVVLTVDRTPPRVSALTATETFYGNRSLSIFTWTTDDITRNTLSYRRKNQLTPFARREERELGTSHWFSLGLAAGTYEFFVVARNTVGLETIEDNHGQYYTFEVRGSDITPNGFDDVEVSVSESLHIASITADFDGDGLAEIVGKPMTTPDAPIAIYERIPTGRYELVQYLSHLEAPLHSVNAAQLTPWAVDDTDNDGLLEILVSDEEGTFLMEVMPNLEVSEYTVEEIWRTPFLSGGTLADLDGDGFAEIIGADNNNDRLRIFENRGDNRYEESVSLRNETDGNNVFGTRFAIDDFNGDGSLELVTGDSEGILFIYTATANDNIYLQWQTSLKMTHLTQFASGDLTGDNIPEFVAGGILMREGIPDAFPLWKFMVWTHTAHGYVPLWEHAIAPYRRTGNSVHIADVDGDTVKELILLTQPNLYIMKWNGTTFQPMWHSAVSATPALFTADLDDNGFEEMYVNVDNALHRIESIVAREKLSVASLTPWGVSAAPLTAKAVQVTWTVPSEKNNTAAGIPGSSWRVYRAPGEKGEPPSDTKFMRIADNLTVNRFLDRDITTGQTYWYAITAKAPAGKETLRTKAVSATPREPPHLTQATYYNPTLTPVHPHASDANFINLNQMGPGTYSVHPPKFWVTVTFDRQMGFSIGDESKYLLRTPQRIEGIRPVSVIRDRMGTRALIAFPRPTHPTPMIRGDTEGRGVLHKRFQQYELTVSNVSDIDRNLMRTATQSIHIPLQATEPVFTDFTHVRVYPNPVYPTASDKGMITFDGVPLGTRIQLFTVGGHLLEELKVTESDNHLKQWYLTSNHTADVGTGIYLYVLEWENQKKIGKIAVIK